MPKDRVESKCGKCGYEGDDFHPSYLHKCRPCLAEYQREYRKKQKDLPSWKQTQRKYTLKKRYGMTVGEYKAMAEAQGWKCGICGDDPRDWDGDHRHQMLHVDHCHTTKTIRGLLCNGCNRAIGLINERPHVARGIADYLFRSSRNPPFEGGTEERQRRYCRYDLC